MNILVLIISSNNLPIYEKNKEVWRIYMNSHSNIDAFFIEYHSDSNVKIENNTIYLPGKESFENILTKTLLSLDYFIYKNKNNKKYDFVVRTNLSTVWDFDYLVNYVETLPKEKLYAGPIGPYYRVENGVFWFHFAGGMAIIMSIDVCELLLLPEKQKIAKEFKVMDDIDIGYSLHVSGIYLTPFEYFKVNSLYKFHQFESNIQSRKYLCYRAKSESKNRNEEPECMENIVKILYPL
jgi:hypothetical protein